MVGDSLTRGRGPRPIDRSRSGVGPRPDPAGLVPVVRAFISRCLLCAAPFSGPRERATSQSSPPRLEIRAGACSLPRRWQAGPAMGGALLSRRVVLVPSLTSSSLVCSVLTRCHATRCPLSLSRQAAAPRSHRCVYLLQKPAATHPSSLWRISRLITVSL